MSERVSQYTPTYLPLTNGNLDVDDPNNPANLNSPLSGADPLHLHSTDGKSTKRSNKFSGSTQNAGDGGDEDTQETSQIFRNAGIPGFNPQQINAAEARVNSDSELEDGVQKMSNSINTMSDPAKRTAAANDVFNAGNTLAKEKNIDIWQLLVVALKGATRDQNEQLRYDLEQLQTLSKVSAQMSQYSDVLQNAQQRLDDKMAAEKDDKKKSNLEVKLNDQRSYSQNDMTHLLADGTVKYTNTRPFNEPEFMRDGTEENPDYNPDDPYTTDDYNPRNLKADDKHNMVSASGLNVKIQAFTQERDQLQKNIDKRQQKYQSDNENKNQIVSAITAVLKNYYDMMSNTARNTSM